MRIGIDLDNTIVCYDGLFHQIAVEQELIPGDVATDKQAVRDYLRAQGCNDKWTELQGTVYGAAMSQALPFPGVNKFFASAGSHDCELFVISHRTKFPYAGPKYDLHQAARDWLANNAKSLPSENVFFEETLVGKLQRVATQRCNIFIDDLPELLLHDDFPSQVERICFDPANRCSDSGVESVASWQDLITRCFEGTAR